MRAAKPATAILAILFLAIPALSFAGRTAASPPVVWGYTGEPAATHHLAGRDAQAIAVNTAALDESAFTLVLPDGRVLDARVERRATHPAVKDAAVTVAAVPGGSAILTQREGLVSGVIMTNGQVWQIRPIEPGYSTIFQIDSSRYPMPECGDEPGAPDEDDTAAWSRPIGDDFEADDYAGDGDKVTGGEESEDGETIDVMVVYSALAAELSGDIESEILTAIEQTNTIYENSGILQRLRLVHTHQVGYEEIGQMWLDLFLVNFPADGVMDQVPEWRNQYGADLVSLWVGDGGNICGIANIMYQESAFFKGMAYSVTALDCAVGNMTFAHELGHNMGARHDEYVDPTLHSPYDYNHGYVNLALHRRTVMAYNDRCADSGFNCDRWPNFSNPDVQADDVPTGTANLNDNARTLNNTASIVAAYRPSMVATTTTTTTTTTTGGETTTTTQPDQSPDPLDDASSADGDDDDSGCGC